jgi:hypothetical protein
VIKQYFRELPDSLIPQEMYTTLKLLYLSKSEDFDARTRAASVGALLATLPTSHYQTLSLLVYSMGRIANGDEVASLAIAGVWGPVLVVASKGDTGVLFDRHPVRVVRDLVVCTRELVGVESKVQAGQSVSDDEEGGIAGSQSVEVMDGGKGDEKDVDLFAFVQE